MSERCTIPVDLSKVPLLGSGNTYSQALLGLRFADAKTGSPPSRWRLLAHIFLNVFVKYAFTRLSLIAARHATGEFQ